MKEQTINNYSRMQKQILKILSDGRRHSRDEFIETIDPLWTPKNLRNNICNLRKKLPSDQDIVCVFRDRRSYYQHVRLINGTRN